MNEYRRKHATVLARQHDGPKIVVNSGIKGNQTAVAGDYLVTDPEAEQPRGSVYVVSKADFERDHELVDGAAEQEHKTRAEALLDSALHALRSYENGNGSTELAKEVADAIEQYKTPAAEEAATT